DTCPRRAASGYLAPKPRAASRRRNHTSERSFFLEEIDERAPAFLTEDAARHLEPVVQARVAAEIAERSDEARLRVVRAEAEARDPREHDRAGAHRARLERHVESAAREAPGAETPR